MTVTVYPKTASAQILTNNASLTLTIAIYALTIIGTFSLFLTLWDRKTPTEKSNHDGNQSNAQTQKDNDKPESETNKSKNATEQA